MRYQVGNDGSMLAMSSPEGANSATPGNGVSRSARRRRKRRERKQYDTLLAAAQEAWRRKGWVKK